MVCRHVGVTKVTASGLRENAHFDTNITEAFQRHSSAPAASAPAEKPLPSTVTGVPPSAAPRVGESDDTAAAGWYVKRTPLDENC